MWCTFVLENKANGSFAHFFLAYIVSCFSKSFIEFELKKNKMKQIFKALFAHCLIFFLSKSLLHNLKSVLYVNLQVNLNNRVAYVKYFLLRNSPHTNTHTHTHRNKNNNKQTNKRALLRVSKGVLGALEPRNVCRGARPEPKAFFYSEPGQK